MATNGNWQKRDNRTGEFMEQNSATGQFKGVAKESDGRGAGQAAVKGAAKDRVQLQNPVTGHWVKVDTSTGRIIDEKRTGGPYKGIARKN